MVTLSHGGPGTTSDSAATNTDTTTYTTGGEYTVVTGVTVTKDTKGHVTGLKETRQKIKSSEAAPGTLNTTVTTTQSTNSSESLSGSITLHKVSKTGNYNDLLNKPTILNNVFIAESGITTYNEVMQACLAKRIVFA